MKNIRNFCIIAHIDHGKSTLADRLIEYTATVDKRLMENQVLDDMDLEKERGITIKSHAIQMQYKGYTLNLIDTPGHVDFSYEVSRSIAACEGALLIVDASQGVQAQTISNLYMALEHDLEIIPVMNKCDMDSAMPEKVEDEIIELLGCKREEILRCSAKTGDGVPEILDAIIERIAAPEGDPDAPLQCLVFDSVFNPFRGIIAYYRIFNGKISKGEHTLEGICIGDGPIDAAFLAIEQIIGLHYELDDFQIQSVTEGREAMGQTVVKLLSGGKIYSGRGTSTDIVGASILAYLNALNKIVYEEENA